MRSDSRFLYPQAVIAGLALFGFGLWLLNDVVPNEDAIFVSQMESGDLASIWNNVSWSNAHAAIVPYAMLYAFKNPVVATRLFAVLCAWISGMSVFHLARMAAGFGRRHALWAAALFLLWPGYMVQFSVSLFSYPFYLSIFLLGAVLVFRADVGPPARTVRAVGAFLVFISFTVNSLLVVFYAMMIAHHAMLVRLGRTSYAWADLRRYVVRYGYLLAMPVAFWILKLAYSSFLPVKPGYNAFILEGAATNVLTFAKAVWHATAPDDRFERSAAIFGALAGVVFLVMKRRRSAPAALRGSARSDVAVVGIGLVLLAATVIPYVLVGKAPGASGVVDDSNWYTRHLLLTGIPVAILLVAIARLAERALPVATGRRVISVVLAALVSCYGFDRIRHCVRYQLVGIQDLALAERLRSDEAARRTYVYGIAAAVPGFDYAYKPDYTWPYFMQRAFGGKIDRYVFEEESGKPGEYYRSRRFSEQFVTRYVDLWHETDVSLPGYSRPPDLAQQLSIVVDGGITQSRTAFRDVLRYWIMRTTDSEQMPGFLAAALDVRLIGKTREEQR
jgi:hypothetical protein